MQGNKVCEKLAVPVGEIKVLVLARDTLRMTATTIAELTTMSVITEKMDTSQRKAQMKNMMNRLTQQSKLFDCDIKKNMRPVILDEAIRIIMQS
eukprot:6464049-Amphidinium_carterae.2